MQVRRQVLISFFQLRPWPVVISTTPLAIDQKLEWSVISVAVKCKSLSVSDPKAAEVDCESAQRIIVPEAVSRRWVSVFESSACTGFLIE